MCNTCQLHLQSSTQTLLCFFGTGTHDLSSYAGPFILCWSLLLTLVLSSYSRPFLSRCWASFLCSTLSLTLVLFSHVSRASLHARPLLWSASRSCYAEQAWENGSASLFSRCPVLFLRGFICNTHICTAYTGRYADHSITIDQHIIRRIEGNRSISRSCLIKAPCDLHSRAHGRWSVAYQPNFPATVSLQRPTSGTTFRSNCQSISYDLGVMLMSDYYQQARML